jgi:biopolymer transport protein ExbD
MPKVKPKRKNPSIDMTAMVDVAFLLLTFFILTTKFKADEKVMVDTPSSISPIKVPQSNLFTITVSRDGLVAIGATQETRLGMLENIAESYGLSISDQGKAFFSNTPSFSMPIAELPTWLNNPDLNKMKDYPAKGIPIDKRRGHANELKEWINAARRANMGGLRFAIKGDRDVSYEKIGDVIFTLQDANINKFNLITGLEADPNGPKPAAEAGGVTEAPKEK